MKLADERGTAAVELALLAPVFVVLLAVVVAAGRMVETKSGLLSVAREAARAASEAPDAAAARNAALTTAREVAAGLGLDPTRIAVDQDPGGFGRGEPYRVRVSYEVRLVDLPGLGLLPGTFVLEAEHAELVDRFKSQ